MKYRSSEALGISTNTFCLPYMEERKNQLEAQVAQQNRQLPVLIHPFFVQYEGRQSLDKKREKIFLLLERVQHERRARLLRRKELGHGVTQVSIDQYYFRLNQLLQHAQFGVMLLGEYTPFVASTIEIIRTIGYQGDILVYETKDADPTPKPSAGNWRDLAAVMQILQVQELYVAGQKIDYNSKQRDKHRPQGCVPRFVAEMRGVLPEIAQSIVVSPVSYPNWWRHNSQHPFFISGSVR